MPVSIALINLALPKKNLKSQSSEIISPHYTLIALRGRITSNNFNDLSFWLVGVPLKMESMMK
jgi:hypothetical protein